MRQAGSIIAAVLVLFVASVFLVPRINLHFAKARAQKELSSTGTAEEVAFEDAEMSSVPKSPPKKIAFSNDYTNTIWLNKEGCDFGFPADRFTRDSLTNRQNVELHSAQYRMLVFGVSDGKEWAPALEFVNETNFFYFSRRAFNTTREDIDRQTDTSGIERCLILLKAKAMLAAVGYTDSCLEFDRGDLKGFIIGDPARTKNVYVRVYFAGDQKYITIGLIQDVPREKHLQFSDLEELISTVKIRSSN